MATVRMSARLRDDMLQNATRKFDKQNPDVEFPTSFGDEMAVQLDLVNKTNKSLEFMQQHWNGVIDLKTDTVDSIYIKSMVDLTDPDQHEYQRKKEYQLSFSTPIEVPSFLDSNYGSFSVKVKPDNNIFVQCYAIDLQNRAIQDRRYAFRNQLRNTLDMFVTLNQALTASDGAYKDLVPQDVLTKVYKKDDRKARRAELAQIAETQMTELKEVLLTDALLGDD